MTNKRLLTVFFSLLLLLGVSFVNAIPENQIIPFNIPFAMSANSDGSIIAGYMGSGEGAYYWTEATGVVSLGLGDAGGVSENDLIVGTKLITDDNGNRSTAGYWNLAGEFTEIGSFPGSVPTDDGYYSDGYAISSDGTVIAGMGWTGAWTANAMRWSAATGMVNLRQSDESSKVNTLSADGSIAAGWLESDWMRYAAYWDANNVQHIIPGLGDSEVMSVSANGQLMVGNSDDSGFFYNGETLSFLGSDEMGTSTVLSHVTNSGLVTGLERNFFQNSQVGIIYNETMGVVNAVTYFTQNGVVMPDEYQVHAVSWVSEDGRTFVGWGGSPSVGFIVRLSESASITGNVTAENGGNVTLASITNGYETVSPDTDGNYNLTVSPGTHTLTITMPGYYTQTSQAIVLAAGETVADVDFALLQVTNSATIQGTISLTGGSGNVAQTTIQAGDFVTHPDSAGNYSLIVAAGAYNLTVNLNSYFAYENQLTVTAGQVLALDVELIATDALNALVINIDGDNIDYANTRIFVNHSTPGGNYFTPEEDGTLYLGILYEADLTISVYAPGFLAQTMGGISTNPYQETVVDFTLEKVYNTPRNLSYNGSGQLAWEAPYTLTSYVDDFESYPTGSGICLSNPMWLPIGGPVGSQTDPIVAMNTNINDGKYLEVSSSNDAIVNVGNVLDMEDNLTSGKYEMNFDIMIPTGFAGHYNIIRSLENLEFSLEVFFRTDGTLQVHHSGIVLTNSTFNHDEWFEVRHILDLTNDGASLQINGEEIAVWEFSANAFVEGYGENKLDLINFSGDSEPTAQEIGLFYIDNLAFSDVNAFGADGYLVYRDDMLLTQSPLSTLAYTDVALEDGTYTYGVTALYDAFETEATVLVVEIDGTSNEDNQVSLVTSLQGNYPNPFNPETTIRFSIAQSEHVTVEIFNLKGQKVKTLVSEKLTKGDHSAVWNGLDKKGNQVNSGLYFYRLKAGDFSTTKKMTLIK